jgi:hypothetical protein
MTSLETMLSEVGKMQKMLDEESINDQGVEE